jgi:hypothetical protein
MTKTFSERTSARIARNAKPRERNVRAELERRVESYGGHVRAMTYIGRVGCPDVLCVFPAGVKTPGRAVWVETKQTSGRLAKHQKDEIALLRSAGQDVQVIVTMAELDAWLPELPF